MKKKAIHSQVQPVVIWRSYNMFDNESVNITVPGGSYPKCMKEDCGGTMFPIIEPATSRWSDDMGECWVKGTAVLYWKCGKCNITIR